MPAASPRLTVPSFVNLNSPVPLSILAPKIKTPLESIVTMPLAVVGEASKVIVLLLPI